MGCTGSKATAVKASPRTSPGSTLLTTRSPAGQGKPTKIPSEVSFIESVPSVASFAPEINLGASQAAVPVLPGGVPTSPLATYEEADGRQAARCATTNLSDNVECLPSVAQSPKKQRSLEETWAETAQVPDLSTSIGLKPWGEEFSVAQVERSRSACEMLPAGALICEEAVTDAGEVTTPMVLAEACNEAVFPSGMESVRYYDTACSQYSTRRSASLTPEVDLARVQEEKTPSSRSSHPPGVGADAAAAL